MSCTWKVGGRLDEVFPFNHETSPGPAGLARINKHKGTPCVKRGHHHAPRADELFRDRPLAYVFILIFLVLANAFTFYLGGFLRARAQADLDPFFNFPSLAVTCFLIPAISHETVGRGSASPAASSCS